MKVAFIARATLYSVFGGDSVQVIQTTKYLQQLGVEVDIKLTTENIFYAEYDLLHFFNIIRPADILKHIEKANKPFVISPIYVDYSLYEKNARMGWKSMFAKIFSSDQTEYSKTIARFFLNGEKINSSTYLWKGQRKSIQYLVKKCAALLPNSENEYQRLLKNYQVKQRYSVIPYAVDTNLFSEDKTVKRDAKKVLCVGRIEGRKNQLNLIKALNDTEFELTLIGEVAPNHISYLEECKRFAKSNIHFIEKIPQNELVKYYLQAKVHVLPSWFETCGLSTMEAAYLGCNVVITDLGDTQENFENMAWYCKPDDINSIYEAIEKASNAPFQENLKRKIENKFTWEIAAQKTLEVYQKVVLHV